MTKSACIRTALVAFALPLFFGCSGDDLPADPDAVLATIGDRSPEEQEKVVLSLQRYDPKDPRAPKAVEALRKMVKEPSMSLLGRAAAIRALGNLKDWKAGPDIADYLYDEDLGLRQAAGTACAQILSTNANYNAAASPEERKAAADTYRGAIAIWYRQKMDAQAK